MQYADNMADNSKLHSLGIINFNWASRVLSTPRPVVITVFCILLFSCRNVGSRSSDSLDCFSERFNHAVIRNASINGQEELDNFVDNITSFMDDDTDGCIQLFLTRKVYKLDMIKIMGVKLGTGGGFVMIGAANPRVTINCVASISGLEDLKSNLKPLANVSLVVLNGLRFTRCPVPVVLEEVSTVIVQDCDFIDHEHGALNIFNSPNVTVKDCTFRNNTSTSYFTRKPFQGNSGGLSIAYNMKLASLSSINVLITDCVFVNNSADPPSHLFLSTTNLIERRIFSGRGGGMAMPVNVECPVNVVINNSLFMNNFASNYGGGMYCFLGGTVGNQTYMFGNNRFVSNEAMIGSGALNFGNYGNTAAFSTLHSTMYNCTFENNKAETGGCLHMFPSYPGFSGNFITIKECSFVNNTSTEIGGAIDVISYNPYQSRQHYNPVQFVDCKFDGNFGGRGATIDFIFHSGKFENVIFNRNRGPVIRAIGAAVEFAENVSFTNNNAQGYDGGALYMLTSSQITLNTGAHLEFINNTGGLGASVVVVTGTVLPVFARNYYNPLCFIQYPDPEIPPVDWEQVSLKFAGNRAIIGSAIYANNLDLCSWYSFEPPYFYTNRSNVLRWPFVSYGDEFNLNNNSGHSEKNSSNKLLAVQTPANDFTVDTKTVKAYPGEQIQVFVSPYDEQDYLTSESFRILERSDAEDALFAFNPTAQTIKPSGLKFAVKYSMKPDAVEITDDMLRNNYTIEVSLLQSHSSAVLIQNEVKKFNLMIQPCPPGHVLHVTDTMDEYECKCDDNNKNIVECVPNENKITLEEGLWAHYVNNGSVNSRLEYYHCPPGYCQCRSLDESLERCSSIYSYGDENSQCICDRKGLLCGECRNDNGVSALLNKCKSCGAANLLLILPLVVADIFLIITILIASVTILSWLFPILFYLQVTPIVAQYFPAPFAVAQPYLQYISSAINLYFPYDFCLSSGMTALVSYSFRYIPFLLSVIISAILYTANRKYKIATNMRLSWSGLWLLTLLLYTDVVNTSISILNCPVLTDSSGRKSPRWYVDGSVECFVGGHIPLAIAAILALLFCVLVVLLTAAIVMRKIKQHWAFSMSNILRAPFTDSLYWWAPIDLLRRLLFVILIVTLPGNLASVLLLIMVYVATFAYLKPYRSFYINVLEVFVLVDIMLQLMIASTHQLKDKILNSENDLKNLTDDCGKVNRLNEHATMLVPFYYLPLLISFLVIVKVMSTKIYTQWYHKHKTIATEDYSMIVQPINTESMVTSYLEFNKDDGDFKMISGNRKETNL